MPYVRWVVVSLFALIAASGTAGAQTKLLWGDTHLHTSYSPDAFLMQNRSADPDTAYRYAKGLPVAHPYHKARIQIETPLDFLVVSDHAEFMGVIPTSTPRHTPFATYGSYRSDPEAHAARCHRVADGCERDRQSRNHSRTRLLIAHLAHAIRTGPKKRQETEK